LSTDSGKDKDKGGWHRHNKEIFIGKKPLMVYVTSTLIQLANQPTVTIKARGLSIGRAVDVSQIILENGEYRLCYW
jgi:DNA-binding protein